MKKKTLILDSDVKEFLQMYFKSQLNALSDCEIICVFWLNYPCLFKTEFSLVHCVREYQRFEALVDIQCAIDGLKIKRLQRGF